MNNKLHKAICAALAGGATLLAVPATAYEFKLGDLDASFDTTLSYGAQWRVAERDERLVGKANLNPAVAGMTPEQFIAAPGAFSVNTDAGNLNYDDGDLISNAAKITSEFAVRGRNMGFFSRGYYFYDFENVDHDGLSPAAQDQIGRRGELIDAFVYGNWATAGGRQYSLRVGRQVINWGESTFIQGGINAINPVDVTALRVAGAELREALLGVDSVWGAIDLTRNTTLELFYQARWRETEPDAPGAFFSTANFVGAGGDTVVLGFGQFTLEQAVAAGAAVPRAATGEPSDSGQYGAAYRWFVPGLDAEFGLYALRYHSRLPLLSGIAVTDTSPSSGRYFTEYPEGIRLFGASFNTLIGETAFQGEYSYRPNQPLQVDDVELLFAALSPLNIALPSAPFMSQLGDYGPGEVIPGFVRHKVGQAQMTATRLFGPRNPFGADQWVVLGEAGITHVFDLPDKAVLRYEGPGTTTGGGADRTTGDLRNPVTMTDGFADATSWGYRLATVVTYNNAFGGWNFSPRVAFQHDVNGTTPGPGGNFIEDRKQITLGANFTRLEKFAIDVSYTNFSGGDQFNLIRDRNFVGIDFKYSF